MNFQTIKGMRDFSPEEMIRRQYVLNIIQKVFEKWGYLPLETPALESLELLSKKGGGGEEIKREIYCFKDQGGRDIGLRFDLTVPLARFITNNPNLPKPFKRYQIERVWRYDNPQAKRYREFLQTDIDIIGSNRPESDAEIIAVTCDAFKELGFKNFTIKLNNRKIIEDFILSLGIKDIFEVFRSIDKLDKIGEKGVKEELKSKKFKEEKIDEILKFVKLKGSFDDISKKIENKLDKLGKKGLEELKEILEIVKEFGYTKNVEIDMSLIRGLDYYTGPVFEVSLEDSLSYAGGGRYDNMIELFGGQPTPATGISLGFERIMEVMKEKKMIEADPKIKYFVAPVNDEVRKDALKICQELRKKGINCDTDLMGRKLSKQLEYASSLNIPYVLIVGKEELKKESVKLKDMKNGKEETVKIKEVG